MRCCRRTGVDHDLERDVSKAALDAGHGGTAMSDDIRSQPSRMVITYDAAIRMILKGAFGKSRQEVFSYFADDDHGDAGRALDSMVLAGDITFDRRVYRLREA